MVGIQFTGIKVLRQSPDGEPKKSGPVSRIVRDLTRVLLPKGHGPSEDPDTADRFERFMAEQRRAHQDDPQYVVQCVYTQDYQRVVLDGDDLKNFLYDVAREVDQGGRDETKARQEVAQRYAQYPNAQVIDITR